MKNQGIGSVIAALLALETLAEKIKIGVLTDIHLQPNYAPNIAVSPNFCCTSTSNEDPTYEDNIANFGRFGCDLPYAMVERAFQKMAADNPDLSVILVPGDYVGHGISNNLTGVTFKQVQDNLQTLKKVSGTVSDLFETYFKEIPVLPTFGNNDTKYHYQTPFGLNEYRFYQFWNENWFTKHSGNKNLDLTDIASTSVEGGWYSASLIPDKLTLLSFNSLAFNSGSEQEKQDEMTA